MLKNKTVKLASSLFLASSLLPAHAATSFDDAIKNATTSGQFRLGYIAVAPKSGTQTTGAAFGGQIKFETEKWKRMQFAIAPYFSHKLDALSGDKTQSKLNGDFFDSNTESYVYLGEAYFNYAFENGSMRIGRQQLDNPFINTDDIRMHPNTFNAVWLNMALSKNLTLDAGVVSEWAGFDSGDSQDKFKKAAVDGVSAIGASYAMSDSVSFQAWNYNFNKKYSQYYIDASYQTGNFEGGVQYSSYQEKNASNVAGNVVGVSVSYGVGSITLSAVANKATNAAGKSADLGLGGGNFYAAMDEMTIGGLTDASAQVVSIEYAATENFTATVAVGQFKDKNKATTDTSETDLVLGYGVSDNLDIEFVNTVVDNKADSSSSFSRNFARVNYNF